MAVQPLDLRVSDAVIHEFVARLVAQFHPERVILFGSYARGEQRRYSDVDLLVEMEFEGNPIRMAADVSAALLPPFPCDIIVRTPTMVAEAEARGDWIGREALRTGRVIYETVD